MSVVESHSQGDVVFTQERMARFKQTVAKYERPACALLPTLYLAQEQFGYLSKTALEYVARLLDMPPREVFEAASFYTMFRQKDMGKWCLQVCNNITCNMMGAEKLLKVIRDELGITAGQVTEDGLFSLVPVQCLGSCDTAPVVQLNETYVENLDPEKLRQLIKDLKSSDTRVAKGLSQ